MSILSSGLTDIGQKRKTNQDSIFMSQDLRLYLVADGMGGHNGGDIASALAVEHIPQYVQDNMNKEKIDTLLKSAVTYANEKIYKKAQENTKLQGMGTTVVLMCFHENHLYCANVGDSRAYLVKEQQIYQLSKDHSLIQEKINLGIYSREEGQKDKMKNVLVRTVGFEPKIEVDLFVYKVTKNDLFLICSDGLHGAMKNSEILSTINSKTPDILNTTQENIDSATKALVDKANESGGNDNISVVLSMAR